MIGLLLVASIVAADEPEPPGTYARLFGEGPPAQALQTVGAEPSPWKMAGALALGAIGLWGAWHLRASGTREAVGRPLKVLCRHPLGDRTALVLLEVIDAEGERRRLLIGTGAGAPTLVADLGQVVDMGPVPDGVAIGVAEPMARAQPCATVVEEVLAERQVESFSVHADRHGVYT